MKASKVMDPDTFLAQDDVHLLVQALNIFALEVDTAAERKDILVNAGIHFAFRSKLIFDSSAQYFTNQLVAHFREYRVSSQQPAYHPMVCLLEYLLKTRDLEESNRELFNRIIRHEVENLARLTAFRAVGRIESPPRAAIGTGVLVGRQLLLTCRHVFERILEDGHNRAWVRFGYRAGRLGVETGDLFEVDIRDVALTDGSEGTLDYALVRIAGKPEYRAALLFNGQLSAAQSIRLIHHPLGEPAKIADGQIVQVHKDYIKHNVKTDYGSSGAPIYNQNWHVVAIHHGAPTPGRSPAPGISEGLPLYRIWDDIVQRLPALVV